MSLSLVFFFLALACMLGVLASLFSGLFFMTQRGKENRLSSNKMMQIRVTLQGLAILFLILSTLAK